MEGDEEVPLPNSGPYGGSGSDKVCDRDKLIRFLKENPDRLREWARVLGVKPTYSAVSKYIAKLHPVTLARDTAVTNHSFVNGRAVPFQAILQAGTAVLVDKSGRPVARCRCGNPLLEPIPQTTATCKGCPANYKPPKQCDFYSTKANYGGRIYSDDYYANDDYDQAFIDQAGDGPYDDCWIAYPDPPTVTIVEVYREPAPTEAPAPAQTTPGQTPPETTPPETTPPETTPPETTIPPGDPNPGTNPDYDCPDQPPAHPGEDYLENCG